MRGLSVLPTLAAGLVLAAPAVAADRPITFADFVYTPPVPATQNGGPLPGLEQDPRDMRHDRRFPAASHREVADADDRVAKGRV